MILSGNATGNTTCWSMLVFGDTPSCGQNGATTQQHFFRELTYGADREARQLPGVNFSVGFIASKQHFRDCNPFIATFCPCVCIVRIFVSVTE